MFDTYDRPSQQEPQVKEYLGDAVYVELGEYGELILTTENGISVTNRIVLEPEVCRALKEFVDRKAGSR